MLVSGREAARILIATGAVTGEAQARAVLSAGLAGGGVRAGSGLLYDNEVVERLAQRPWLSREEQHVACPQGVYVARLSRATRLDTTQPWDAVISQVDRMPKIPVLSTALLGVCISVAGGRLPWVATLHGFVVVGADLTGFKTGAERQFRLAAPGEWFASWEGRRIPSGRGGRSWVIRMPRAA
jgi:hypothetical protein